MDGINHKLEGERAFQESVCGGKKAKLGFVHQETVSKNVYASTMSGASRQTM
jgi:hypothetical protein